MSHIFCLELVVWIIWSSNWLTPTVYSKSSSLRGFNNQKNDDRARRNKHIEFYSRWKEQDKLNYFQVQALIGLVFFS